MLETNLEFSEFEAGLGDFLHLNVHVDLAANGVAGFVDGEAAIGASCGERHQVTSGFTDEALVFVAAATLEEGDFEEFGSEKIGELGFVVELEFIGVGGLGVVFSDGGGVGAEVVEVEVKVDTFTHEVVEFGSDVIDFSTEDTSIFGGDGKGHIGIFLK